MDKTSLLNLKKGTVAEIVGFDGRSGVLSKLQALGLCTGKTIKKVSDIKLRGPVIVSIDRAQVAIGHTLAGKILVKVLSE